MKISIETNSDMCCDDCDDTLKDCILIQFNCIGTVTLCQKHAKELLAKLKKVVK